MKNVLICIFFYLYNLWSIVYIFIVGTSQNLFHTIKTVNIKITSVQNWRVTFSAEQVGGSMKATGKIFWQISDLFPNNGGNWSLRQL